MPKSNTRKLNDTQLVILSSASQREDGFAVLPEGVRAASGKAAVIRLTKLGFLKQVRVKRDQPHWFGRGGQADRAKDHQRRLGRDWRRRRRQGRGGARAGAEAPVQEGRRAGRGSARGRRASPRVEARTDHRPDAGHGGGYPQRHGRGDRLAPAHHPGRSDGPAPQGLCHRERQERQSRDGVPDRRCRRGHVEHRRRGARVRARVNGHRSLRDLGRLANGSGSGLRPSTASRTVASPATSSSTHVEAELIRLACADTNSLARRWRVLFGGRAPDLPGALLQRILAYRIQADAAGDLDPTTIKLLDRLGRGEISEIPLPELRAVKPGTLLVREWEGTLQRVVVLESGFAWNGVTYESLSKVARAITGTNWNGPRFFGLRDRARAS